MSRTFTLLVGGLCSLAALAMAQSPDYQTLFNGTDLSGWKGLPQFWSVKDGAIVGQTTAENPTEGNTFLVWQGGEVADFEFLGEVRFEGNNSGVQYRSAIVDAEKFVAAGYQADLHPKQEYFGMLYGEKMGKRGIIATRGQRVMIDAEGNKEVAAEVGNETELVSTEWNELRIVAVGNRLIHQVNGVTTVDISDNLPDAPKSGILGLQLHAGPPMKVEFRNVRLRPLKGEEAQAVLKAAAESKAPATPKTAAAGKSEKAAAGRDASWLTNPPAPQWIWHKSTGRDQTIYFRKSYELPAEIRNARVYATCDNRLKLWINGQPAGESPDWPFPIEKDVTTLLKAGATNLIAAEGKNDGGSAGLVLKLTAETADGKEFAIVSDNSWKLAETAAEGWQAPEFDDSGWNSQQLVQAGAIGRDPWKIPAYVGSRNAPASPVPAGPLQGDEVTTLEGFQTELLYTVPKEEQGSWVAMTVDPEGRLIASDQGDKGLYRITVTDSPEKPVVKVEALNLKDPASPEKQLSGAQGLVWSGDSLYVHVNGGLLHRVRETDGNDLPDLVESLPSTANGGEHGNHAVIQTAEGGSLLIAGGNHATLPPAEAITRQRVPTWDEDLLLPRMWDARGHARGRLAPGGWVTQFNPETKTHELVCIGFRNQYDLVVNRYGDVFTFDADMEWDMGMPWYRPTRICQVVSGGDYGWRSGSGKWPSYYEDSLPAVLDIGPGSPTGMVAGTGARFPARYQDALYAFDWTFGTIHAVHLIPAGAGYRATSEPFVSGSPLPVTDGIIGKDGAFYFLTGGRGTESALYRVRYIGKDSIEPGPGNDTPESIAARTLRRQLEGFHGEEALTAIPTAWTLLSSKDRFLRNAARIAIESQPPSQWADKVFSEPDPQARIAAAVGLARAGDASHRAGLISSLLGLDPVKLTDLELLGLMRAYSLTFIRLGQPTAEERKQIIEELNPLLPHKNPHANTELLRLLTHLDAPGVVDRGMALILNRGETRIPNWQAVASRNERYGSGIQKMLENHPPSQALGYAFILRNVRNGWTLDQRRKYFEFLNQAAKGSGGASFPGFLENIRAEALANCTDEERQALADVTGENFNPVPDFKILPPKGPRREWTLNDAQAQAARGKADFENGRNLYFAVGCGACHRLAGLGGSIGPDLTSIPNKFDAHYVLQAILEPSKDISDQYNSAIVKLKDGSQLMGLVVEKGDLVQVWPPDPNAGPSEISRSQIASMEESPVSQMPPGLINALNPEELRDLMAYLMSGANPEDRMFR